MITEYHAKYFAYELTKQVSSDSYEKFTNILMDAKVDLNPHQIEAALFAFKSPFSKGAILADEVGLGKTIEAGIVISQNWAERKRKILLILPSSLRKQWSTELQEKFYLPSIILESKYFNKCVKDGNYNPFNQNSIAICSYHFARNKADFILRLNWDLVICDEAHRLRNVYKKTSKIANSIKEAVTPFKKILLTATPLQNSLLELYGLVSIIDNYSFGDLKSFKAQYSRIPNEEIYSELKNRLQPICKRTLRKQVIEYIRYTKRIPITQEFIPTDDEQQLYEWVTEYLQRPNLQALPSSQRTLMTLVLRKLLASSTFAIAGALNSLANKLNSKLKELKNNNNQTWVDEVLSEIIEDYEAFDEDADEWEDEEGNTYSVTDIKSIQQEINDLQTFKELAISITENAKGEKLLVALEKGFQKIEELGGEKKAVVFTESRKTQDYVLKKLSQCDTYKNKIVLFNGSNTDEKSKQIYNNWIDEHKGTDVITGVKSADIRAALVDFFKNEGMIMIATEAAAEGINLQFCSLIVNYDLPWNPQRIEQRIGRCHRYGQKFDVVVVNFLNIKNQADIRVHQLLTEKFKLFEGVFGVSDEVLGVIESGVDFEKRILEIYQKCRSSEEIQNAFDNLQNEFESDINQELLNTRQKLLENFDEEVHEKLKIAQKESETYLSLYQKRLYDLSHLYLKRYSDFEDGSFFLKKDPTNNGIKLGRYTFSQNQELGYRYRIGHPLAQWVIKKAKEAELEIKHLKFIYSGTPKITILEDLIGKQGIMIIKNISIESFETIDSTIISAVTNDDIQLDNDQAFRLFSLTSEIKNDFTGNISFSDAEKYYEALKCDFLHQIDIRNSSFFDEEIDKLDAWADDLKKSIELEIKEIDIEIKTRKTEARKLTDLNKKVEEQRAIKHLEGIRKEKRKKLFDAQDEIDEKKEKIIKEIQLRMSQKIEEKELFRISWEVVQG